MTVERWSQNLSLSKEGLWISPRVSAVSYPEEGNEDYFQIEEKSFWFQHRNQCLGKVMKRYPPEGLLFDIGGGNGFVSKGLEEMGFSTVLVEPGLRGCQNGQKRGLSRVVCSAFQDAGFPDHSLPAIGLFDVVEHIEDDRSFLKALKAKIGEKGRVYLTVPAYSGLWSQEDGRAGHYRRYSLGQICKLLEESGFRVEYSSYFFSFLLLPLFLARALPFRLGIHLDWSFEKEKNKHATQGKLGGWLLEKCRRWETHRMGSGTIPFGTSCLVVAKSGNGSPDNP